MAKVVWHGDQLVALVHERIVAAMSRCGFALVPMVQAVTPVETGAARASVTFEVEEAEKRIVLRFGGTVSYWIWIEIGTHGRPGAAPLGQTFPQAIELVKGELKGLV